MKDLGKSDRGRRAYLDGQAAEDSIAARYLADGHTLAARRWRGKGGEIDLIFRKGTEVIFVEVKRAASLAMAAERLSARQLNRIFQAGAEFLGTEPGGDLTPARVDLALVDHMGRHDVLMNIQPG